MKSIFRHLFAKSVTCRSSGESLRLLFRRSEFESKWSTLFSFVKCCFKRTKNLQILHTEREERERERIEIEKYFWHIFCKKLLRERMTATITFLQSWKTFFWVASTHVCRLHYYKNFSILIKYEPADQCDQMILS